MKSPAEEKSCLNVSPAETQEIDSVLDVSRKKPIGTSSAQEESLVPSVAKFYAGKEQLNLY